MLGVRPLSTKIAFSKLVQIGTEMIKETAVDWCFTLKVMQNSNENT